MTHKIVLKCYDSFFASGDKICECRQSKTPHNNIVAKDDHDLYFGNSDVGPSLIFLILL